MEIYLDNAATTRPYDSVRSIMLETLDTAFGNPSSMHGKGFEAERYVKEATDIIAKSLKADPKEIIFTSGGTESNNLALIGAASALKRRGNHIITTMIEHPSVHNPVLFLEENGYRVTYVPVDSMGRMKEEELLEAVGEDTILVSFMYVNNEVGSIQPISEMSRKIKEKNPNVCIHVDAIQAYGKFRIYPAREGIDLLSASGHKIHGPKGVGFLYVNSKVKIKPVLFGGGQQRGIRSGTENVPGIAGLGQAVKEGLSHQDEIVTKLYEIKAYFIERLKEIEGTFVNCTEENIKKTAPHILSVSFEGIKSEVLLHALEDKGIYVSAGSACASNHPGLSGTLKAVGLRNDLLDSTIRFSFSGFTTIEEAGQAIEALKELVPVLRKYSRR
ncbi:cysteine desulfurase family protein [Anaerocolumna sp. AGMB13020]|uniref:cysteine desulfurase family protein n=1 Tax=Anaerocolumna sp. AGMB13020 TaxID=3081750 RepID=UPI002954F676|nr:cysteine desulfurase family protein [Anaerocolumna sp. AGMB13020]WOO36661.1 cysteine desulfurase family protein [Anaerocolumna sp. AGMB13020]